MFPMARVKEEIMTRIPEDGGEPEEEEGKRYETGRVIVGNGITCRHRRHLS